MSEKSIHPPMCPACKVNGTKYIVQSDSSQESNEGESLFNIAHCSKCGHIYGVVSKVFIGPRRPSMTPPNFP